MTDRIQQKVIIYCRVSSAKQLKLGDEASTPAADDHKLVTPSMKEATSNGGRKKRAT